MLMMLASGPPQPLGQFVLQASWASGSVGPKPYPADAHDARLLARQMAPTTGAVCSASAASRAAGPKPHPADAHDARLLAPNHWGSLFCKRLGLRGPWGQNPTQLMLMMLASWPQTTGASRAVGSKPHPADAHDARLPARQMAPTTGAVCSANVLGFGVRGAKTLPSSCS